MNAFAILLPVIFPIIAGACLLPVKFSDRKARQRVVLPIIVLNAIFALYAIFFADSGAITIFRFSNRLSLALHVDGLSKIFGTMVSLLWIPTTIYAFEYMTHEGHEDRFFSFFTMTFGVVIGIAFADNFLTMYLFYEFLTLVTLPIVMHQFDNKAAPRRENLRPLYDVRCISGVYRVRVCAVLRHNDRFCLRWCAESRFDCRQ